MKQNNVNFVNLSDMKVQSILKEYSVEIPADFVFSDINIVIGSNGSGKTRLLHAVRELYRAEGKNKVMYGYFPHLAHSRKEVVQSEDLPVCTLYESLQENEIEFEDFLKEVELHNEEYIPQLLTYHSRLQKERGEKALKTLQETFRAISGQEILFKDGIVCIKDKNDKTSPLKDSIMLFSPGELMIFYMSVFLSLQKHCNIKRVIILDEPECHLHPKALLEFVRLLKKSKHFTSIWIATHSLFLLPEFDFPNIIYVDNSKVCPRSSRLYKDILANLLGNDIEKTTQFMASLSQWQYSEYIAECFTDPTVIDTINPEDEQVKLFVNFIETHKTIRVLDFGGGSARLGLSLKVSNNKSAKQILYEIYDRSPQYTGKEFVIHKFLGTIKNKYDCIVMMNVLHEVEPLEWPKMFKDIYGLLNEGAYLLFVETSVLSKGEMPNKIGFLVLDNEELNVLFSCSSPLSRVVIKEGQKSVCVPIPKEVLANISTESVGEAISVLEKRTFEKIITEREKANFEASRYYAFLTQLYINAQLFNRTVKSSFFCSNSENNNANRQIDMSDFSKLYQFVSSIEIGQKLINYLQQVVIPANNKDLCEVFRSIYTKLQVFCCGTAISEDGLNLLWRKVVSAEKRQESKFVIALFWLCLYVMGDIRGKNRIINNDYKMQVEYIINSLYKK